MRCSIEYSVSIVGGSHSCVRSSSRYSFTSSSTSSSSIFASPCCIASQKGELALKSMMLLSGGTVKGVPCAWLKWLR
eukprot:6929141-Ditylum_brightwellii.AAC.1